MSDLPPITRIKFDDVTDAPKWFEPFLDKLNQELEYLRAAFDKGITLAGNVEGMLKELQIRTRANYETGEFTEIRFDSGVPGKLNACDVKQAIDLADPTAVLAGPLSADWRDAAGQVRIRYVSGLRPSRRYLVRFHVW